MGKVNVSRPTDETLDDQQARELVNSTNWYHRFELRPGLESPGVSEISPSHAADAIGIPQNLHGKRVLDIGAWDGALTFELERRGATAYALDIQDPARVGFNAARKIMNSSAVHYQGSVYDLPCEELNNLDVVVFRGVYYHLKHPILAFECIAAAMKMGGTLHFEGEGLVQYIEDLAGNQANLDTKAIIDSNAPICLIYPNKYKGYDNWFVPTPTGLKSVLKASGFDVVQLDTWTDPKDPKSQRLFGTAVKIREQPIVEHPLY